MKYILNELLLVYPGILVGSFLSMMFAPWSTEATMANLFGTMISAYVVMVLWIVARTCYLTVIHRREKKNQEKSG